MASMSTPIVPWVGGKRRLAKRILSCFPEHKCYVEPFCGGAALFFSKEPSTAEVLNDINGDLINLYQVVKHHLEEFVRQFKWALSSRQLFDWLKETPPQMLTDIQRAARFYYLQQLTFGGKVSGQSFGTSAVRSQALNLLRIEEQLSQAHLRLSEATIEHLGWQACIEKYDRPHTLFYLDPPYWETQGYAVAFGLEQYSIMDNLAHSIEGKMIISVNDIPEMRRIFKDLHIDVVDLKYSLGSNRQRKSELIISNFA
ncbi:MAG: DNA adenine methylase [Candidatus Symbiopectobacterium sp. Dall1.0]|nr:DNA adenine methylase [Candidatus Symbiopectobacterium sp. Dall1.0]